VLVVDSWGWETPRTKDAIAALAALKTEGRVLVVLQRSEVAVARSFRNLPHVQVLEVGELNAYDVLCNDVIVFSKATLPVAEPTGKTARRTAAAPAEEVAVEDVVAEETEAESAEADDEPTATDADDGSEADEEETS
jgi:large subunit ribosomal protein L4